DLARKNSEEVDSNKKHDNPRKRKSKTKKPLSPLAGKIAEAEEVRLFLSEFERIATDSVWQLHNSGLLLLELQFAVQQARQRERLRLWRLFSGGLRFVTVTFAILVFISLVDGVMSAIFRINLLEALFPGLTTLKLDDFQRILLSLVWFGTLYFSGSRQWERV